MPAGMALTRPQAPGQRKPQPQMPMAPLQTQIAGQTYVHAAGRRDPITGQVPDHDGVAGGSYAGPDGSVWSPVPNAPYAPGGGAAGRGSGPGAGGGNPFDFWGQYQAAQNRVPQIPPRVPQIPDADRTAAEAAEFGRAKDRIGLATQGLMKSIRNNFSKRGLSGSPLAMSREAGALEHGAGQIGETIRDQAISGLNRQYDVRDQNYQGDLSQRGQDISAEAQRNNLVLSLVRAAFESGRY